MVKMNGTLKYALIGASSAIVISTGLFFTIPSSDAIESKTLSIEEQNYSRTLYGVPDLELEHYKLSEDKYFDYLINGTVNVGRPDPITNTRWYQDYLSNIQMKKVINDAIENGDINTNTLVDKEDLLRKLNELNKLNESNIDKETDKVDSNISTDDNEDDNNSKENTNSESEDIDVDNEPKDDDSINDGDIENTNELESNSEEDNKSPEEEQES